METVYMKMLLPFHEVLKAIFEQKQFQTKILCFFLKFYNSRCSGLQIPPGVYVMAAVIITFSDIVQVKIVFDYLTI